MTEEIVNVKIFNRKLGKHPAYDYATTYTFEVMFLNHHIYFSDLLECAQDVANPEYIAHYLGRLRATVREKTKCLKQES